MASSAVGRLWAVALWAASATAAWADPARITVSIPPEYPMWARGTGISTEVELRVLVGRDGRARRVQVLLYDVRHDILTRSLRASFDSAAVLVVRRWGFAPATRAGRPVAAWLTVRVPFTDPVDTVEIVRDPR